MLRESGTTSRLKQMQKAASRERKSVLREQRNMIKAQLSTNGATITRIKRNRAHSSSSARRQSGPLRVYSINAESARSEVSVSSRPSSVANEEEEVVVHSQSVVSRCSQELRAVEDDSGNNRRANAEFVKRWVIF